ncbi:MAG: hypothetical protein MZW92_17670 [Comamonadaceae bacterium]|nr:hypothetical protein [Comamonadaceae bacterium]
MDRRRASRWRCAPNCCASTASCSSSPPCCRSTAEQIGALLEAARAEWTQVEPAIFGTLLERALDPVERHALGAHYTPRAYVERLVMPAVIEPLREDWANVQAAALLLAGEGKIEEARTTVRAFHHRLCETRVLDPACGSGNFLYVALEHMKRLEGEVLNQLEALGRQPVAGNRRAQRRPAPVPRPRTQPPRRRHRRTGAVDRLPAMAFPHPRQRPPAGAGAARLPQHRMPRRRARLRQGGIRARRARHPGQPLGRPHDEAAPGHRRGRARRDCPRAAGALRRRTEGRVAAGGFRGRQSAVHRHQAHAQRAGRRLHRGPARRLAGSARDPPTSSCTGGSTRRELTREGRLQRFGLITTNSLRQTFNRRVIERTCRA